MKKLAGALALGSTLLLASAARGQSAVGQTWSGAMVPNKSLRAASRTASWPATDLQFARDRVKPGSELEKLILANQDFALLRPEEATDDIPIPPWLRVLWRKAHPKGRYSPKDPTGGYPLVLREIHEWLLSHQDLVRGGLRPVEQETVAEPTTETGEERISGVAAEPRSESAIRVNPFNPQRVIAASNDIGGTGQMAISYSSDGGVTWGQSRLPLLSTTYFQSDPTVEWTSDGTAWSTTIGVTLGFELQLLAFRSADGGATWAFDATVSGSLNEADKEMLWADHSSSSPFKDNLYSIWHDGSSVFMARRTASTGTWQNPVVVSGAETTGTGIGADVVTNAAGDLFGFWPDTGSRGIFVVKSSDGGVSLSPPRRLVTTSDAFQSSVPANNLRRALIYVSAGAYKTTAVDNVYATWSDLSGESGCAADFLDPVANASSPCKTRIWFSRSLDGGNTWSQPIKIDDPKVRNDQFFQWLYVDQDTGKLSIVYYDTILDPSRLSTQLFYQSSDDAGATWSTPAQVTSASTNETLIGADLHNQYGDYLSLSGAQGLLFPSWTDRRNGNFEEIWSASIADPLGCGTSAVTTLTAAPNGTSGVALSWSPVPGAAYQVFRAPVAGGPYSLIGASTSTAYFDPAGTCDSTSYYVVRVSSGCASSLSNEVSYGNRPSATVYRNDFESSGGGLSDWAVGVTTNLGTTSDWSGVQSCLAHSGQNSFRFGGASCQGGAAAGDFISAQPGGPTGIAMPAGSTFTKLSFWHHYDFSPLQGGGALAVTINPGTNYLVPPESITGDTYSFSPATVCTSDLPTLEVFSGTSTGFVNTTVDLDSVCSFGGAIGCGGTHLEVSFLGITTCDSPPQPGWYVDDVAVTTCPAAPVPAMGFYTLPPCRLVDTRNPAGSAGGPPLTAGGTRAFALTGACGIPATARALSVNVTAVNTAAAGFLNLFADDQSAPPTSVVAFGPGETRAVNGLVALGSTGGISVLNTSSAAVNFILDVNGYFQ